jgi:hypothetical protein
LEIPEKMKGMDTAVDEPKADAETAAETIIEEVNVDKELDEMEVSSAVVEEAGTEEKKK